MYFTIRLICVIDALLCLSREIEMFYRCETIAIFIDIIWAASVKPGLFPAPNQRTDFGRSLLGTCVRRLSRVLFLLSQSVLLYHPLPCLQFDANIAMLLFIVSSNLHKIVFGVSKTGNCLVEFPNQAS